MSFNISLPQGSDVPTLPIEFPPGFDPSKTSVNLTDRENGALCPSGFVCNKTHQASCFEIQEVARSNFLIGDIHGGAYCPEGSPFYLNCPAGKYCPDPSTVLDCPAGKFCPPKTAVPEIECRGCLAGAESMVREPFGFALIIIFFVLVAIYIASIFFHRHVQKIANRFEDLSNRVLTSTDVKRQAQERLKQLERIRPRLEIIMQRVRSEKIVEEADSGEANHGIITKGSTGLDVSKVEIRFDPFQFFDTLDKDGNGVLTYEELNAILQFDILQLNAFVKRMNMLDDGAADEKCITRGTFCHYFLDVLEETSSFQLTPEEAGAQWDDIARHEGTDSKGHIRLTSLYHSSLCNFLTDIQIKTVILQLREMKRKSPSSEAPTSLTFLGQLSQRPSMQELVTSSRWDGISRELFCEHYPTILENLLLGDLSASQSDSKKLGIDIAFQNLKLTVKVGRNKVVNVVDDTTGRIRSGTMTALMGGSGAGKTSLLNALCGRAYYGEVVGNVMINGNEASIEDFSRSIGFVPQDDIVFAELTVRENLMYSGRLRLPRGTPLYEIEDLVDTVLANLGLARKADSLVGDVTRRGLSGGEKKRVNIGLELMAKPSALFLDEPTSGLDSSSALLVMKSLEQLVKTHGVTVCSVIHQPRKFIFDLFDSVLLLGVGGRMVYHGTVDDAEPYFSALGYSLPNGESLADWLIDISTGRVAPNSSEETGAGSMTGNRPPSGGLTMKAVAIAARMAAGSLRKDEEDGALLPLVEEAAKSDRNADTSRTTPSRKQDKADDDAKVRRELLYQSWCDHFDALEDKEIYDPPNAYELPQEVIMASFWTQFLLQIRRIVLLGWRNRVSKTIESSVVVFAVAIITVFEGTTSLTTPESLYPPLVPFEALISNQSEVLEAFLPSLFEFSALSAAKYVRYGLGVGVIASVLIALISAKAITDKRLEFFREAGSGCSVNAYFLAVNITSIVEQGTTLLFSAIIAQWMLHTISGMGVFYLAFLLMGWISTSWALLIPLIVPPQNTTVVLMFFMAFFGFLLSGTIPPVKYSDIYQNDGVALFSAWCSAPRFFSEMIAVSDLKCLPPQTGYTVTEEAINFPEGKDSFSVIWLGQNDSSINDPSCTGWYWNVLPALLVGVTIRFLAFGAINTFNRSKQAKKSFLFELRHKGTAALYLQIVAFVLCSGGLIGVTCWAILRHD